MYGIQRESNRTPKGFNCIERGFATASPALHGRGPESRAKWRGWDMDLNFPPLLAYLWASGLQVTLRENEKQGCGVVGANDMGLNGLYQNGIRNHVM